MDEGNMSQKIKSNNQPTDDEGLVTDNPSKLFEIYKEGSEKTDIGGEGVKSQFCYMSLKKQSVSAINIKDELNPNFKKSLISICSNVNFLSGLTKSGLEEKKKKRNKKKKVKFELKKTDIIHIESYKEYNKECCYKPQIQIEIRRPNCFQECAIFFSRCLIY